MGSRRTASLIAFSFVLPVVLLLSGCSGGEVTAPETGEGDFEEGTLSSDRDRDTTSGLTEGTDGSEGDLLVRVEGAGSTRFSGLCTVGDREYVISGRPSKTYSFEDQPFSCRIKKRDSGGGNLKVTVVSNGSTRSVQQTSARGGTVDVSGGSSGSPG